VRTSRKEPPKFYGPLEVDIDSKFHHTNRVKKINEALKNSFILRSKNNPFVIGNENDIGIKKDKGEELSEMET
jgi:hypothetical protein